MFTLGLLYIFLYIATLISLMLCVFVFLPLQLLSSWSLTTYLTFLKKYTNIGNLFYCLIFILTGLPPLGFFVIKFNILVFILYQSHIIIVLFLFLIFFCNMLYYIQIFNTKNYKMQLYTKLSSSVFKFWNSEYSKISTSILNYYYVNFIISIIIASILTVFFFTDIYLLTSL